jgi:hypothetical protein
VIVKEAGEPLPLIERVADGFGDFRSARELGQSFFEPGFQRFDERSGPLLSNSLALIGAAAAKAEAMAAALAAELFDARPASGSDTATAPSLAAD